MLYKKIRIFRSIQKTRFQKHKKGIFEENFMREVRKHCKEYHIFFEEQYMVCPYIVDIYFPSRCLAIEIDEYHHLKQQNYDSKREQYIMSFGIFIIRYQQGREKISIKDFLKFNLHACFKKYIKKEYRKHFDLSKEYKKIVRGNIDRVKNFYMKSENENKRFENIQSLNEEIKKNKSMRKLEEKFSRYPEWLKYRKEILQDDFLKNLS